MGKGDRECAEQMVKGRFYMCVQGAYSRTFNLFGDFGIQGRVSET